MEETVSEMLVAEQTDEHSGSATAQLFAERDRSLMTPLGLAAGEILTEVEWSGATTLRRLIRKLDWPMYLVLMAVGVLVRQGLIRATQRELEVIVEPIPKWSGVAQAEVM